MRILSTIFLLGLTAFTFGQKKGEISDPFQVVYAEHVENSKGGAVQSLDMISTSEVLTVRQNGYLLLVYDFGFPVEITGDTVISIADLHSEFKKLTTAKKRSKYVSLGRPNTELLFIANQAQGRYYRLQNTAAVHDGPVIQMVFPPSPSSGRILYRGDLCLKWKSLGLEGNQTYELIIMNLYEKEVRKYPFSGNTLQIPANEMNQMVLTHKYLLLKITEVNKLRDHARNSETFGLTEFPAGPVEFPYICSIKKASHALIVALHAEMKDNTEEAEKYYRLAAELSDKEFFRTMLSNFMKRQGR